MPREVTARQPLCADIDGFSLHAAVRIEAHELKRLERLCRSITRPALSEERIQVNAAGQVEVELELKTPWRDGRTHLVMSELAFMQRLAALVPRPRLHLNRYRRPRRSCGRGWCRRGRPLRGTRPPRSRRAPSARKLSRCGRARSAWAGRGC
jgi:hypothetical protein